MSVKPFRPMGYKRIIAGKTYNTETAALVYEVSGRAGTVCDGLYQTKHGAFFLYWRDESREACGIKPMADEAAQKWLEAHNAGAALIERYFGEPPEAAAESRITLRLPGNLHSRIAASAEAAGVSLNTYIMRLLERSESPATMEPRP